jgi:hypothetical protein
MALFEQWKNAAAGSALARTIQMGRVGSDGWRGKQRRQVSFRGEKRVAILRAGCVLETGAYCSIAPIPPPLPAIPTGRGQAGCHHRRLAALFRHPASRETKCNLRSASLNRRSLIQGYWRKKVSANTNGPPKARALASRLLVLVGNLCFFPFVSQPNLLPHPVPALTERLAPGRQVVFLIGNPVAHRLRSSGKETTLLCAADSFDLNTGLLFVLNSTRIYQTVRRFVHEDSGKRPRCQFSGIPKVGTVEIYPARPGPLMVFTCGQQVVLHYEIQLLSDPLEPMKILFFQQRNGSCHMVYKCFVNCSSPTCYAKRYSLGCARLF